MKNTLLLLLLLVSLQSVGQSGFLPKDTIKDFSLRYVESGGGRDGYYSIDITSKGKVTVIQKAFGYDGLTTGRKDIKLDANTMRVFKNQLITQDKLYALKDTLEHSKVSDAPYVLLTVDSNQGKKIIFGHGRENFDADYKRIVEELNDLVGITIGDEY